MLRLQMEPGCNIESLSNKMPATIGIKVMIKAREIGLVVALTDYQAALSAKSFTAFNYMSIGTVGSLGATRTRAFARFDWIVALTWPL
jgi:hypothetical protein